MQDVVIPRHQLQFIIDRMDEAIRVCEDAETTDWRDPMQDPCKTYPGATGWSRACMGDTVITLRQYL